MIHDPTIKILLCVLALVIPFFINAQLTDDEDKTISLVGGVSPFILNQGSFEISNVNVLTSFWTLTSLSSINSNPDIRRVSNFLSRTAISYGFSESKTWDIGLDITYSRARNDGAARNSPFKIFNGESINRSAFSQIGLRARVAPFNSLPGLVFQGSIRLPIAKGDDLRRELGANVVNLNLNTSYYKFIDYNFSYYFQAGWSYRPSKNAKESEPIQPSLQSLSLGGYLIINTWSRKLYLMPGLSYSGTFQSSVRSSRLLQKVHAVLGEIVLQYKLTNGIAISLQQGYPILFESYTPSIEFERSSFSQSSISLQMIF